MGGESLEFSERVRGKALIEAAIAAAEVRALGEDGRVLASVRGPLDAAGLFWLERTDPATVSRVEIEDLGSGEVLRAELGDEERKGSLVYVSGVSTLISAFVGRHPEASPAAATAAVKAFLGIPASADLGYDLADGLVASFDLTVFQADARSRGGVVAQTGELLEQMAADTEAPSFAPATPRLSAAGFGDQLLDSFLGGLAASAAQKVASSLGAPGWMMSLLGGKNEDAIKGQLDQIKNRLNEQKNMLIGVVDQVSQVGTSLEKTRTALAAAEEMKAYQIGAGMALEPIAVITLRRVEFRTIFDLDPADPVKLAEAQRTVPQLRTQARTGLWICLKQIHDLLTGSVVVEGLTPLWVRLMGRGQQGFANGFVDHVVLDKCHEQFKFYAGHQLTALQILIEACHAETPVSSRLAQKAAEVVAARLQEQMELIGGPARLDDRLIVHRTTSLLWQKKGASYDHNGLPVGFSYQKSTGRFLTAEPLAHLASLKTAGFEGWRLPTEEEIRTLVAGRGEARPAEWLDAQGFRTRADGDRGFYYLVGPIPASRDPRQFKVWDPFRPDSFVTLDSLPAREVVVRLFPVRSMWPAQPRAPQLRGLLDSGFRFLAKKIAGGVGGKIGGETAGWILRAAGADTDDPVLKAAGDIQALLGEQKKLIEDASRGLATISRQVDDLRAELLDLSDKTLTETLVRQLLLGISEITAIHEMLGWMAEAEPSPANRKDVESLLRMISPSTGSGGVGPTLERIHLALLPSVGLEGILPQLQRRTAQRFFGAWDPLSPKRPQFFTKALLDELNNHFDYFYGIQILGLQLLVEACEVEGRPAAARQYVTTFEEHTSAQAERLIGPRVPHDDFLYNDRSKTFWAKAPINRDGNPEGDRDFEWSPVGNTFPKGDPLAALRKSRNPNTELYQLRFLAEADLVGKADLPQTASTFRLVFWQRGFDRAFDVPIWIGGAAGEPTRMEAGFVIAKGRSEKFKFTVLPVLQPLPQAKLLP